MDISINLKINSEEKCILQDALEVYKEYLRNEVGKDNLNNFYYNNKKVFKDVYDKAAIMFDSISKF